MSVLETKGLTKIYGSRGKGLTVKALDEFNMQIKEGEFVGIMGPSGSGKTTLSIGYIIGKRKYSITLSVGRI